MEIDRYGFWKEGLAHSSGICSVSNLSLDLEISIYKITSPSPLSSNLQ